MKNWTKWAIYGAVPAALSLVMQLMYFSGNLTLQRLVCPKLPPLTLDAYREFGLLEILQNLLLVAIGVTFVIGVFRTPVPRLKWAYVALTIFTAFVLLEETDYGSHFYEYATTDEVAGWFQPASTPEFQRLLAQSDFSKAPFNLHNRGDATDIAKAVVSVIIVGLFIVAPLFRNRIKNHWLRFATPDRFIIVTVLVMLIMRLVTRYLADLDAAAIANSVTVREVGSMNNNLSEFRELLIYYTFLIYTATLVFRRPTPANETPPSAPMQSN